MDKRWPTIFLLWFAGVVAAAQLGKMAALMPAIRADLGLSLTGAGLMVSLIEAGGASCGAVAGILAARYPGRAVLALGTGLIVIAGLAAAAAPDVGWLYAARAVEGLGYLMVVIAAPSLIAMVAGPARATALALWSTFVPVGIALGAMLTAYGAAAVSWRGLLVGWALVAVVTLPASLRLPDMSDHRVAGFTPPPLAVWALALGFGFYTTLEVGVLAMLPAYFSEAWGFSIATAGMVAGLTSAATIAGSFAASRLMPGGGHRRPLVLIAVGLGVPAALFVVAFPPAAWAAGMTGGVVALAVIVANAVSGLVAAVAFARLPEVLKRGGAPLGLVTASNGVFAQFGASGSLIGPPLIGWIAGGWGWAAVAPVVAGLSVLSLAGFAVGERLAGRR